MIENNELNKLVQEFDTPMYIYDKQALLQNIKTIKQLEVNENVRVNYATKANSNLAILNIIKEHQMKADATGIGEVFINKQAGFSNDEIYVVGNNLKASELKAITDLNLKLSVDSIEQLKTLNQVAPGYQNLLIRINPSFGDGENKSIITGGDDHKFGIDIKDIDQALSLIDEYQMKLIGVNQHIGSLNLNYKSIIRGCQELLDVVKQFNLNNLEIINFGGGFGINYKRKHTSDGLDFDLLTSELKEMFDQFISEYQNKAIKLEFEPGRFVVATSSILVGQVCSIKHRGDKIFVGTDLGFTNMIRPTLYNSYHEVEFITTNTKTAKLNVVGDICESGDYLCKERELIIPNVGDLVIVHDTGAYGYSMASNFNSRQKPIEILKDDNEFKVIRKRQKLEDLLSEY